MSAEPSSNVRSVAIMVVSPLEHLVGQYYFTTIFAAIRDVLAQNGMTPILLSTYANWRREVGNALEPERHVAGAILLGLHDDDRVPNYLTERGLPFVVQGPGTVEGASHVDADNQQGARIAVEHLIGLGRRRIATITGNLDLRSCADRLHGYRDARAGAGLDLDPTLEENADFSTERAHMAMERLLLNHPDVDGVFAASDEMAVSALEVLEIAHKRVPEDVAVICYDDTPRAAAATPPLSAVRQPVAEMGREATRILLRQMDAPDVVPTHTIFTPELVARASTIGKTA